MSSMTMVPWNERASGSVKLVGGLCVFLAVITWLVFGQTRHHEFVNYDDQTYVFENPAVASGLTFQGVTWAFTHSHAQNWHPLTTISHMFDCQLYGLKAGGHHLTNVLLHIIAVILLFLVLDQMTDAPWRSAFVAAVFAIHPLHVESVAWIAERKDVLSAVFFMLTLAAYVRYTARRTLSSYVIMSILFACGLMSKPMLVTLPFVLLLLDYWPLGRNLRSDVRRQTSEIGGHTAGFEKQTWLRLILEKVPLFALAAGSCLATTLAQTEALNSFADLPLRLRIGNALVTYVIYVWKMFWPTRLAIFYPHPYNRLPFAEIALVVALLLGVTALAFALRKSRPYLIAGWLWYLVMLAPVIGIVQVGDQARADRYTYLPQIGLFIAVTWAVADLFPRRSYRKLVLASASTLIIAALATAAWKQTTYWKNSESLWTHAIAVTSGNDIAHSNLGLFFMQQGRMGEADSHFKQALDLIGTTPTGRSILSAARVHNNLGLLRAESGQLDEALSHYEEALNLIGDKPTSRNRPSAALAHSNLGNALLQKGQVNDAIAHQRNAVELDPDYADGHYNLGTALLRKHEIDEAIVHYERSLQIAPLSAETMNNLAWVLATCPEASLRNGQKAIELAQKADQLSRGQSPVFSRTLAAAYAETGRFNDAIAAAQRSLQLANDQNNSALASKLQKEINLYRANHPRRDLGLTNKHPTERF
jgi:tetratricopeptide (TPR) repeat protein